MECISHTSLVCGTLLSISQEGPLLDNAMLDSLYTLFLCIRRQFLPAPRAGQAHPHFPTKLHWPIQDLLPGCTVVLKHRLWQFPGHFCSEQGLSFQRQSSSVLSSPPLPPCPNPSPFPTPSINACIPQISQQSHFLLSCSNALLMVHHPQHSSDIFNKSESNYRVKEIGSKCN